jgi:hypothetical protein
MIKQTSQVKIIEVFPNFTSSITMSTISSVLVELLKFILDMCLVITLGFFNCIIEYIATSSSIHANNLPQNKVPFGFKSFGLFHFII